MSAPSARLRRERPVFAQAGFLHGNVLSAYGSENVRDVCWQRPDGQEMEEPDWHTSDPKTVAMVLAAPDKYRAVVCFNAFEEELSFSFDGPLSRFAWRELVSTVEGTVYPADDGPARKAPFVVPGRSVLAVGGWHP